MTTKASPLIIDTANITSVGTLSSLSVTANITSGNATLGNLVTGNYFSGNGSLLTAINGANVTGNVANAVTANVSLYDNITVATTGTFYPQLINGSTAGNYAVYTNSAFTLNAATGAFNATLVGGTLTTAAQPNVTSTGTLSNLAVTGNTTLSNLSVTANTTLSNLSVTANTTLSNLSVTGNTTLSLWTTLQQSAEVILSKTSATGVVTHDMSTGATFYHTSPSANFTANFTNVSTTDMRAIVAALVIIQGATPYVSNAVQIEGVAQTIKWLNSAAPGGTASKTDIISFTLMRVSSAWSVYGQYSTYG